MKTARKQGNNPTIRFKAKLSPPNAGSSTIVTLPKASSAKLPSRGMTMVEGAINAFPFRAALRPNGKGSHSITVNKVMYGALGTHTGDTVTVEITRVGEEPQTRVPTDLRKALATAPGAKASWMDITALARRDWIFSVTTAKQQETRRRRIEKACDMLSSGKRRLCCFPGIKSIMSKNAKSCGMWLPLPDSKTRRSQSKEPD